MVNKEMFAGSWNEVVGAVKDKYGQITDDDLTRVEGNLDQLVGLLQRKTGQTKQQVQNFLDECCADASTTYRQLADQAAAVAGHASQYVQDSYEQVADRAERGYEYARETVSHRPVESLAIVAGLGILAGVAIGISLSSRR